MIKMAGRSHSRFMQRTHNRITERSDAFIRGENDYGVDCIYCEKYFPNVKKPSLGGYICKSCKNSAVSI